MKECGRSCGRWTICGQTTAQASSVGQKRNARLLKGKASRCHRVATKSSSGPWLSRRKKHVSVSCILHLPFNPSICRPFYWRVMLAVALAAKRFCCNRGRSSSQHKGSWKKVTTINSKQQKNSFQTLIDSYPTFLFLLLTFNNNSQNAVHPEIPPPTHCARFEAAARVSGHLWTEF